MRRYSALVVALSFVAIAAACDDDPTSTPPGINGPNTNVSSSSGGVEAGASSSSGTPVDSGSTSSSSSGAIPKMHTVKIANLTDKTVNVCVAKANQTDFTGPLFRAEGIPADTISERVVLADQSGNKDFKWIEAGKPCTDPGIGMNTVNYGTQAEGYHAGIFRKGGQGGGWTENLDAVSGKESVLAGGGSLQGLTFLRDDATGSPVALASGSSAPVSLDADVAGAFHLSPDGTIPDRKLKTKAGGTLTIWGLQTKWIVCDESAASVSGLTDCSASLRAP